MNIISSSSIKVTFNVVKFHPELSFGFTANYAFHNEETCGRRRISSQIGTNAAIYWFLAERS